MGTERRAGEGRKLRGKQTVVLPPGSLHPNKEVKTPSDTESRAGKERMGRGRETGGEALGAGTAVQQVQPLTDEKESGLRDGRPQRPDGLDWRGFHRPT